MGRVVAMAENTHTVDIDELVADTLDWVTTGEPSAEDLIDLSTMHFDVVAKYGGFLANDDFIIARADFLRDGSEEPCRVELLSTIESPNLIPGEAVLTFGQDEVRYPTHGEALRAFYQWCATGERP